MVEWYLQMNAAQLLHSFYAIFCGSGRSHPIKELRNAARIAYSHADFWKNDTYRPYVPRTENYTAAVYPNLFSAPYPSSYHPHGGSSGGVVNDSDGNNTNRTHLMLVVGALNHGDIPVRHRIRSQCNSYGDSLICRQVGVPARNSYTRNSYKRTLGDDKRSSDFCLEPGGDSPWRKSLSDDISFGCVPVLFDELTDGVAPWFWGDWKASARVLVPRDEFAEGRIDLKELLGSAPDELVKIMRNTLKEYGRRFLYSLEEDDQVDGVRTILEGLRMDAEKREEAGLCS